MKTLIIVSHPQIQDSSNQQFFKAALPDDSVTWHHLETCYPDYQINLEDELALLSKHQRIIFQFPFYWYSVPAHLKLWQDTVLASATEFLKNKELGLVISTGVAEKEYQAGGKEEYTLSEFLKPFERIAHKFKMRYLPPYTLSKYAYLTEIERFERLIAYQQMMTMDKTPTLIHRSQWMTEQLKKVAEKNELSVNNLEILINYIDNQTEKIEALTHTLNELKED